MHILQIYVKMVSVFNRHIIILKQIRFALKKKSHLKIRKLSLVTEIQILQQEMIHYFTNLFGNYFVFYFGLVPYLFLQT